MLRVIEELAGDWRWLDQRIDGLSGEIEALARLDQACLWPCVPKTVEPINCKPSGITRTTFSRSILAMTRESASGGASALLRLTTRDSASQQRAATAIAAQLKLPPPRK
jgi:hypothetical protein